MNKNDSDENYKEATARIAANVQFLRTKMRDDLAAKIITGICAADWKFDTSEKTWDQIAARRAYEIADAMLNEREITNV